MKENIRIYFVRHGETAWNEKDLICGTTDLPLTEKGRCQAMEAAEAIRQKLKEGARIDAIIHSPLLRAKETAACIHEVTGIPMREDGRLAEQDFGEFEGKTRLSDAFRASKRRFADDYGGGESLLRLAQRVYNLLDELLGEGDQAYLLVAHNGIARMTHSYFNSLNNDEYASYRLGNGEVAEYS